MTGLRLDKWLWFARFARTRSLAAKLCSGGRVAIGDATVLKPGQLLRPGDVVTVEQGRIVRRVTVVALGQRRGSAADARLLYAEHGPPRMRRDIERADWVPLLDEGADETAQSRRS
jgi:ribosome-associated heat shock protein Hsp15